MNDNQVNYKCLFLAFGLLTFVYLLSEYTIYKFDMLLDGCVEDSNATLEINIYIHDNSSSGNIKGDESQDVVVANSTILHKLLNSLVREKRQSSVPIIPGYVCTADLFRKVDSCCPTPVFISEREMQNCQRRRFARSADLDGAETKEVETTTEGPEGPSTEQVPTSRNLSQAEIELGYDQGADDYQYDQEGEEENETLARPPPASAPAFFFRWSPVRIIQVPQRRYYAGRSAQRQQQAAQPSAMIGRKTPTRQIISPESVLNVDLMFTAMTAMVPSSWGALLATAKSDCSNIVAGGGLIENVRDGNNKVCLMAPIKMMRCIKRSLIMACPSYMSTGPQCTADTNTLKSCDILAV